MEQIPSRLSGPVYLQPVVWGDPRGSFHESYRENVLAGLGVTDHFVQDNHSRSARGVLRGLHMQIGSGQSKLVRCARGRILDVVVDVRRGSPTWGQWEAFELDDEQFRQIYVPVGFLHGFCVLSDVADVVYKCNAYYAPDLERSVAWNDPDVGIDWPVRDPVVSERDAAAGRLADIADELPFTFEG